MCAWRSRNVALLVFSSQALSGSASNKELARQQAAEGDEEADQQHQVGLNVLGLLNVPLIGTASPTVKCLPEAIRDPVQNPDAGARGVQKPHHKHRQACGHN